MGMMNARNVGPLSDEGTSLLDELRRVMAELDALPTPTTAILVHPEVPINKMPHYYDTLGRKLVWSNPAVIDALERRPPEVLERTAYHGIPVLVMG
jgi:hypothetical protein